MKKIIKINLFPLMKFYLKINTCHFAAIMAIGGYVYSRN